jgi:alpha-ribazole phosphatase/probable phosphoglycerate mutase
LIVIDLIRHVKVDGKAALYGKTDIAPLFDENRKLLAQLTLRPSYHVVLSSPLQRCSILAQHLANQVQQPLIIMKNFQEINFGLYDGIAFDDISAPNKDKLAGDLVNWSMLEDFFQAPAQVNLPEAELLADFNQRIIGAWNKMLKQQYKSLTFEKESQSTQLNQLANSIFNPDPKRIAIVAHGGVIRMILASILAVDWKSANWHQNLNISHGSLTTITVTQPFQDERLLQQVNNIAMPLLT